MKLENISPVLKHFNLPNIITTLGLVFGIFAAFYLTRGDLRLAIIMLFFAGLMDLCDGFVAVKLNQVSNFGKHLDTLVDFFTCVIMPIWMVFDLLCNNPFVIGALVFYCICGLWRLANYNLVGGGKHFTGLPVPAAMSIVTIAMWFVVMQGLTVWVMVGVFALMGMLMLSTLPLAKYGKWQVLGGLGGVGFLVYIIIFGAR